MRKETDIVNIVYIYTILFIYYVCLSVVGIVLIVNYNNNIYYKGTHNKKRYKMANISISDAVYKEIKVEAVRTMRTIGLQTMYWIRLGKYFEENPNLSFEEVFKKVQLSFED